MELRYLRQDEKEITRKLWERIFIEDEAVFLDYYYTCKTKDNEIMVLEEEQEIRAMLQMNPYTLCFNEKEERLPYIVGVATDGNYRHRGYMRRLLEKMLDDMYKREQSFAFLMPAAEAIYKPFGFQFIYRQSRGRVDMSLPCTDAFSVRRAEAEDLENLAVFSQELLSTSFNLFAKRDCAYYEVLLHEQESEAGAVMLIYRDGQLAGYFFYAEDGYIEVREPVILPEYETLLPQIIKGYFEDKQKEIRCIGLVTGTECLYNKPQEKPIIMGRIVYLPGFVKYLSADREREFVFRLEDSQIAENNGTFRLTVDQEGGRIRNIPDVNTDVLTIGSLTGFLTGYLPAAEVFTGKNLENAAYLRLPGRVFLNEIV